MERARLREAEQTGDLRRAHGPAIDTSSLRGADITVSGTGTGDLRGAVHVVRANADALVVRDNVGVGLTAEGRVTLRGSTISGNDAAAMGIDIAARRVPRLRDSSCGRSSSLDTGLPLGVCAGD